VSSQDPFHAERIPGATAWRLTFLAIQGGGSVILFSALGHVLHRPAFAATAVAQGVIVLAQALGDFGLSQAAVTVLPTRIAARPEAESDLLAGAALVYLGAAVVGALLTLAAVPIVPAAAAAPVAVSAPAAAASVIVAGADGILRSRGEFRRPVVLMALSEGAGFAGVPVALATHSAVWTCAAVAAGMALGAMASLLLLARVHRAGRGGAAWPFFRASLPLGLSQVFIVLGTRADTLLAGGVSGLLAAGAFEGTWRVYQLSQYAAGGVATAAAPFIADALGAGRLRDGRRMLGRLILELLAVGVAGAAILYFARDPLAHALTGSLAGPVARALSRFALLCPLAAVSLAAFYTLAGRDGQRRFVLVAHIVGAAVNIALGVALAPSMGARGIVTGCAVGLAVTDVLLLMRLVAVMGELREAPTGDPLAAGPPGLAERSR
jgi:O-antigen/teichoic acid export membrane protein